MILRQLGSNQTELSLNNGNSIFFSYETPVAGFDAEDGFLKLKPITARLHHVTSTSISSMLMRGILQLSLISILLTL